MRPSPGKARLCWPFDARTPGEPSRGELSLRLSPHRQPHLGAILVVCLLAGAQETDLHSCSLRPGNMKGSTSLLNCSQSVVKVALLCLTGEPWLREDFAPHHLEDGDRWELCLGDQ